MRSMDSGEAAAGAWRLRTASVAVAAAVYLVSLRRSHAEQYTDFKLLYYQEEKDRIRVIAPTVSFQKQLTDTLTIRIEGIYNSISGATPTGAPKPRRVLTAQQRAASPSPAATEPVSPSPGTPVAPPTDDEDDDDDEEEDEGEWDSLLGTAGGRPAALGFRSIVGATPPPEPTPTPTPAPTPAPSDPATPSAPAPSSVSPSAETVEEGELPLAEFDDERYAATVELTKRFSRHTASVQLSYSGESDYDSVGVAARDAVDFNQKNTTLTIGAAYTYDRIRPVTDVPDEAKHSADVLVGVTQLLGPQTLLTANLTLGWVTGYLSDPYKVVELNGVLVPEKRPDEKLKEIGYVALSHFFAPLHGSAEGSYRFYNDSFGIQAHTAALAWYQKLGPWFVLRPLARYTVQSEADFYGVRFTGDPVEYSSDYRVSAFQAWGYGLKLVWTPVKWLSFDAAYERYAQRGRDDATPREAYPAAHFLIAGARLWF